MIRFIQGNLLDDPAEALVNTVNEVGVMGKGIALMFKEQFPEESHEYELACKAGEVRVGHMFVTKHRSLWGPKWIIHFPTKKHWRHPSKLEWIRAGLKDLVSVVNKLGIKSVALPPLGCGNGGLEWSQVSREIDAALSAIPEVEATVYIPTSEYHNAPKREGVKELTPARALVAGIVRRYAILGLDCTNLEVQKLAWFLNRVIRRLGLHDPLNLRFKPNKYGPYSDSLRHLLNGLDGSYLHCEKRLADAGPLDLIWFEGDLLQHVENYLQAEPAAKYFAVLEETATVIDGFQSPLGMELLATVDWLLTEDRCEATVEGVRTGLGRWLDGGNAARRKLKLFDDRLIRLALDRLSSWYTTNS